MTEYMPGTNIICSLPAHFFKIFIIMFHILCLMFLLSPSFGKDIPFLCTLPRMKSFRLETRQAHLSDNVPRHTIWKLQSTPPALQNRRHTALAFFSDIPAPLQTRHSYDRTGKNNHGAQQSISSVPRSPHTDECGPLMVSESDWQSRN